MPSATRVSGVLLLAYVAVRIILVAGPLPIKLLSLLEGGLYGSIAYASRSARTAQLLWSPSFAAPYPGSPTWWQATMPGFSLTKRSTPRASSPMVMFLRQYWMLLSAAFVVATISALSLMHRIKLLQPPMLSKLRKAGTYFAAAALVALSLLLLDDTWHRFWTCGWLFQGLLRTYLALGMIGLANKLLELPPRDYEESRSRQAKLLKTVHAGAAFAGFCASCFLLCECYVKRGHTTLAPGSHGLPEPAYGTCDTSTTDPSQCPEDGVVSVPTSQANDLLVWASALGLVSLEAGSMLLSDSWVGVLYMTISGLHVLVTKLEELLGPTVKRVAVRVVLALKFSGRQLLGVLDRMDEHLSKVMQCLRKLIHVLKPVCSACASAARGVLKLVCSAWMSAANALYNTSVALGSFLYRVLLKPVGRALVALVQSAMTAANAVYTKALVPACHRISCAGHWLCYSVVIPSAYKACDLVASSSVWMWNTVVVPSSSSLYRQVVLPVAAQTKIVWKHAIAAADYLGKLLSKAVQKCGRAAEELLVYLVDLMYALSTVVTFLVEELGKDCIHAVKQHVAPLIWPVGGGFATFIFIQHAWHERRVLPFGLAAYSSAVVTLLMLAKSMKGIPSLASLGCKLESMSVQAYLHLDLGLSTVIAVIAHWAHVVFMFVKVVIAAQGLKAVQVLAMMLDIVLKRYIRVFGALAKDAWKHMGAPLLMRTKHVAQQAVRTVWLHPELGLLLSVGCVVAIFVANYFRWDDAACWAALSVVKAVCLPFAAGFQLGQWGIRSVVAMWTYFWSSVHSMLASGASTASASASAALHDTAQSLPHARNISTLLARVPFVHSFFWLQMGHSMLLSKMMVRLSRYFTSQTFTVSFVSFVARSTMKAVLGPLYVAAVLGWCTRVDWVQLVDKYITLLPLVWIAYIVFLWIEAACRLSARDLEELNSTFHRPLSQPRPIPPPPQSTPLGPSIARALQDIVMVVSTPVVAAVGILSFLGAVNDMTMAVRGANRRGRQYTVAYAVSSAQPGGTDWGTDSNHLGGFRFRSRRSHTSKAASSMSLEESLRQGSRRVTLVYHTQCCAICLEDLDFSTMPKPGGEDAKGKSDLKARVWSKIKTLNKAVAATSAAIPAPAPTATSTAVDSEASVGVAGVDAAGQVSEGAGHLDSTEHVYPSSLEGPATSSDTSDITLSNAAASSDAPRADVGRQAWDIGRDRGSAAGYSVVSGGTGAAASLGTADLKSSKPFWKKLKWPNKRPPAAASIHLPPASVSPTADDSRPSAPGPSRTAPQRTTQPRSSQAANTPPTSILDAAAPPSNLSTDTYSAPRAGDISRDTLPCHDGRGARDGVLDPPGAGGDDGMSVQAGSKDGGGSRVPSDGQECVAICCGHVFHTDCISSWIKSAPAGHAARCPTCREMVTGTGAYSNVLF